MKKDETENCYFRFEIKDDELILDYDMSPPQFEAMIATITRDNTIFGRAAVGGVIAYLLDAVQVDGILNEVSSLMDGIGDITTKA